MSIVSVTINIFDESARDQKILVKTLLWEAFKKSIDQKTRREGGGGGVQPVYKSLRSQLVCHCS